MASFSPAYTITQRHEGGWVNNPADAGGETYRGIARKIWASWKGWKLIDLWKIDLGLRESRGPRTGEFVASSYHLSAQIDAAVEDFYRQQWDTSRAGQINSQAVANAYFDLYILSSKAVLTMQQALNELGAGVSEDNAIGPQTISAINSADPNKLLVAFGEKRKDFHTGTVAKGYGAEFLDNWLKRADSFIPDMVNDVPGTAKVGLILTALIIGGVLYTKRKKQAK